MNNCPPELHSYIVRLACTDDGSTVRALLRVSRYFHSISAPFIYQSIALDGPDSILKVAEILGNIPVHRRKIRHLFISDKPRSRTIDQPKPTTTVTHINPQMETAMIKIVLLAAPTLESLGFLATNALRSTSLISRLFRVTFPRLKELTVHGYYPFPTQPNVMPVLERLHLSGNRNPHGLLQLGGLDAACPSLTHLRVSGLGGAVAFADELHDSLFPPSEDGGICGGSSMFPAKLPKHVRVVVVQPTPASPLPAKCGTMRRKAKMMMDRLNEIANLRRGGDGTKFILEEEHETEEAALHVLRKDWIDRLAGGKGPWD